ncbi:MAG: hypothetical protein ACOX7L_05640 [Dethiobacteria bacterium]
MRKECERGKEERCEEQKVRKFGGWKGVGKRRREEKKMVQITDRDIRIFKFLAKHRFGTAAQIARFVEATQKKAYKRLNALKKSGYIGYERIFYREPGVYFLRSKGCQVIGLDTGGGGNIVPGTYKHDLGVIDIALYFYEKGYEITAEKEFFAKQFSGFGSQGKKERKPDLVAVKDDETIAIELEIAVKGAARMKKIVQFYMRNRKYTKVIFFCAKDSVSKRIKEIASKSPHIEVIRWKGGNSIDEGENRAI